MLPIRIAGIAFFTAALSTAFLSGTAVQAHAKLVSSTPAASEVVAAPTTIELRFDETLIAQFSGVDLVMTEMPSMQMNSPKKIDNISTTIGADGKTLVATLKTPLSAGTYKLDWRTVTTDTHRVTGSFSFMVE